MSSKGDLSDTQLTQALWFTQHKVFLWRLLVFSLFFANLLILANLWYQWVTYMFQKRNDAGYEASIVRNLIDFRSYQQRHAPALLKTIDRGTVSAARNLLDGYVLVENPNADWMVEQADMIFTFAGGSTMQHVENLWPGTRQYVFFYGHPREQGVGFIPTIENIRWHRVAGPQPTVEQLFVIREQSIDLVGGSSGQLATRARFQLMNISVMGFWQVPVDFILFDHQNTVVGINSITVNAFQPRESREVSALWYDTLPAIQRFVAQIPARVLSDTNRMQL